MFRCDHHRKGAYCVSLLKLQCQSNCLKYFIVVNLVVWLSMLSGPCWCVCCTVQNLTQSAALFET